MIRHAITTDELLTRAHAAIDASQSHVGSRVLVTVDRQAESIDGEEVPPYLRHKEQFWQLLSVNQHDGKIGLVYKRTE